MLKKTKTQNKASLSYISPGITGVSWLQIGESFRYADTAKTLSSVVFFLYWFYQNAIRKYISLMNCLMLSNMWSCRMWSSYFVSSLYSLFWFFFFIHCIFESKVTTVYLNLFKVTCCKGITKKMCFSLWLTVTSEHRTTPWEWNGPTLMPLRR